MKTPGRALAPRQQSYLVLALLCAALALLAALRPLAVPDEGRYGDIARWMLQSGDWLTPRLNGIPFFHKPALLYWLQAAAMALLGVHAWVVRLVPAAHAALMLLALYLAARQWLDETSARRAVWMLGTSLGFLIGGQYVNHDMLVAAWISVAILCFALAFMAGDRPHADLARAGFVACALGVLSKGLIGLALPGLVLLVWLLYTRQWRKITHLPWVSGLVLFALVALPWFVLAQQRHPGMLGYMFGVQHFARYTGTTFNNAQPWWFYLAALCALLFPWVLFALYQGWATLRGRAASTPVSARPPAPTSAVQALCWIWLVAIVVFFSVPRSKLIGYVLPVLVPLALLAALGWQRALAQRAWAPKLFAALCAVALLLAGVLNQVAARYTQRHASQDAALWLACHASAADTVYALGDYPYDLPFYAQLTRPLVVLQDWPAVRRSAGDNWRRELFEGADFDAQAGQVLQTPQVLDSARQQPGQWVIAPKGSASPQGWLLAYEGRAWTLWQSAAKRPVTAEPIGLRGCQN